MIKLLVKQKDDFDEYSLLNVESDKVYKLVLIFYGDINLEVGDTLQLPDKLLDTTYDGYNQPYCFEKTAVDIKDVFDNMLEYAFIVSKGRKTIVKRIYG